jgi:hypothetical protein
MLTPLNPDMRYIVLTSLPVSLSHPFRVLRNSVLSADRARLVQNYEELQEFASSDTVTVDGETMHPEWVVTKTGRRPVLRLPVTIHAPVPEGWSSERIFTRVVPGARGTSMLVHVREGCVPSS